MVIQGILLQLEGRNSLFTQYTRDFVQNAPVNLIYHLERTTNFNMVRTYRNNTVLHYFYVSLAIVLVLINSLLSF